MMTRSESHSLAMLPRPGQWQDGKGIETMTDRMSLIVFSGTIDKLLVASTLAVGGAAMDMQVEYS